MAKRYMIPCSWEMYGFCEVNANSVDEAIELVDSDITPLPKRQNYVASSFQIDEAMAREMSHG